MTDTWYAPQSITFTRQQVFWLLENYPLIKRGDWPPCPSEKVENRNKNNDEAYYTRCGEVLAFFEHRIERAGEDGLNLLTKYALGVSCGFIGRCNGKHRNEIWNSIKRGINKVATS